MGNFPGNPMPVRMMGRGMPGMNMAGSPYNGANIQVKASAPNTIQYLPARPQIGNNNPRGPAPNIEFLQRFTNPMNQMEGNKMGGMGFYPNCNQIGPNPGGPQSNEMRMGGVGLNHPHMERMIDGGMGPGGGVGQDGIGPMDGIGGGGIGGMQGPVPSPSHMMMGGGQGSMMMRGLRPPNSMRMPGPPGHMMGGPNVSGRGGGNHMYNGPPNDGGMFLPGMQNPQMFGPGGIGGKGNRMMGGLPPDASQPLPPSMGGGGPNNVNNNPGGGNPQNFKSGQFIGANTNDPRYAEEYLKFQQELYATNTGSQMNTQQQQQQQQGMGGGLNQNQQFFVNKKFA